MADPRLEFGSRGERLAEAYLKRRGLKIVARRYRAPVGEIDLVFRHKDLVVFVEVKTRSDRDLADPQDAVNVAKRRKLLKAARWFLNDRRWHERPCRFDVVAVLIPPDGKPQIEHFPDAFVPERW